MRDVNGGHQLNLSGGGQLDQYLFKFLIILAEQHILKKHQKHN